MATKEIERKIAVIFATDVVGKLLQSWKIGCSQRERKEIN